MKFKNLGSGIYEVPGLGFVDKNLHGKWRYRPINWAWSTLEFDTRKAAGEALVKFVEEAPTPMDVSPVVSAQKYVDSRTPKRYRRAS